jgi:hypothetical protein
VYPITLHGVPCGDFLSTALTLYHILSGLSRGFLKFLLRKLRAGRLGHTQPLPTVRHLAWVSQLPRCSLPLTLQIIAHLPTDCNRQNTQNRDFYFLNICATFRLTNCWRYVIMEFPAAATVGGRLKKPPHTLGRSKCGAGKIQFKICGCSGSHPLNPIHNALHASPIFVATRRAHSSAVKIKLYKSIYKLAFSGATPTSIS